MVEEKCRSLLNRNEEGNLLQTMKKKNVVSCALRITHCVTRNVFLLSTLVPFTMEEELTHILHNCLIVRINETHINEY